MNRYSDTFFRAWLLILIPVILLPLGEYFMGRHPAPQVSVNANIYTTQPLSDGSPWTTAAQVEASNLQEWLQSPSFDYKVALSSQIYAQHLPHNAQGQAVALDDLGQHVHVTANGDNLVAISYQTTDGQEGLQVVYGLLSIANQTALNVVKWQQGIVGSYYAAQLQTAQQQEAQAAKQLTDYTNSHNISPSDYALELDSDPTFATLYNQNKIDQQNVSTLEQEVLTSSANAVSPVTVASKQAYFVIDQPSITLTYTTQKKILTNVVIALVLGLLVGGVLLVMLTAMDKTMRYAREAQAQLGLPVVGIVERSPRLEAPGGREARAPAKKARRAHQVAKLEHMG
jgi:hypothetical protein